MGLSGWVWGDWGGFYPCLGGGSERDRENTEKIRVLFHAVTLFVTLAVVVVVALVSLLHLAQRARALEAAPRT